MENCRRFLTIIDFSWIKVSYQADLYLDINKDYVVAEHQTSLNVSNCPFMASLFPSLPHDSSKSSKFSSIGSRFKALIEKTNLNPSQVGDIIVGTLIAEGSQRATECRMAAFYAAFPEVAFKTLNRQGTLGLQAVVDIAAAIKAGFYDIGIGAGVESMSTNPIPTAWEGSLNPKVQDSEKALDCLIPSYGYHFRKYCCTFWHYESRADRAAKSSSSAKVSHEPKDKKEKPQGLVTRSTSASKGNIQSKVSILYCTNSEETSIHG